jgi:hypothetical protein
LGGKKTRFEKHEKWMGKGKKWFEELIFWDGRSRRLGGLRFVVPHIWPLC